MVSRCGRSRDVSAEPGSRKISRRNRPAVFLSIIDRPSLIEEREENSGTVSNCGRNTAGFELAPVYVSKLSVLLQPRPAVVQAKQLDNRLSVLFATDVMGEPACFGM